MGKSHAAGWSSDAPTPAQLKELFAQIASGKVTKDSLQEYLRSGVPAKTKKQKEIEPVITPENLAYWRVNHSALFDALMDNLLIRGCPRGMVDVFRRQRTPVLAEAARIALSPARIPFLPVIGLMTFDKLMKMVRNGEERGKALVNENYFDSYALSDFYWVFDVDDGRSTLGKSVNYVQKMPRATGFPLSAKEGVSLCVHTDTLSRHNVFLSGSRHGADDVADLWLDGGEPKLSWNWADDSHAKWGSASCGRRLSFCV